MKSAQMKTLINRRRFPTPGWLLAETGGPDGRFCRQMLPQRKIRRIEPHFLTARHSPVASESNASAFAHLAAAEKVSGHIWTWKMVLTGGGICWLLSSFQIVVKRM